MRISDWSSDVCSSDLLVQFGDAEIVEPGIWRLSRLLRGRAGTVSAMSHPAGEPFVLLDDPALLTLPDDLAAMTGGGGATLQWAPRNGTALTAIGIAAGGQALRPPRSEEHTSELQSLMRISNAGFCLQ